MAVDVKTYLYQKGSDSNLDAELSEAPAFSKVRPGKTMLFWKSGLRWYCIPYSQVQRIHRRINTVVGRLCCGGRQFDIEYLVLILQSGEELVIHIGDDVKKKAESLLEHLKTAHPEIPYGKV